VIQWRRTPLAVVAVLAACEQPVATSSLTEARPSAAIADAARGSVTDFYWRAPTVHPIPPPAARSTLIPTRLFSRPTGMSNLNNEGFAIASQAECVANAKPVFWADDAATSGHALRRGTVSCVPFSP
jgi:hypothetical protein